MIFQRVAWWIFVAAGAAALWLSLSAYTAVSRVRPDMKGFVVVGIVVVLLALCFWACRHFRWPALLFGIGLMSLLAQLALGAPHDADAFSREGIQLRAGSFFFTFLALLGLLLIATVTEYGMVKLGIARRHTIAEPHPPTR